MTLHVSNETVPHLKGGEWYVLMSDVGLDELHAFAKRLRVEMYFQNQQGLPHYDLSEGKRIKAIRLGAVPTPLGEIAVLLWRHST